MKSKPAIYLSISLSLACFWSGFAALIVKAIHGSPLWVAGVFVASLLICLGALGLFCGSQPEEA